jgi:hypothetical protein
MLLIPNNAEVSFTSHAEGFVKMETTHDSVIWGM